MITASLPPQSSASLVRQLSKRAQTLGEERGKRLARALRDSDHNWRSAAALWPDLELE